MKLKYHKAQDIKAALQTASESAPDSYTNSLSQLSAALHELQQAGVNVSLDLHGAVAEQAFKMKVDAACWKMRDSGILSIGSSRHLVAFMSGIQPTKDSNWRETMVLLVSQCDIRYQGQRDAIRTKTFDLAREEDCLMNLQNFIISVACNQAHNARADVCGAFNQKTQKPLMLSKDIIASAPKLEHPSRK